MMFKNLALFLIFFTFLVSGILSSYLDPILSLHIMEDYQVPSFVTPLFWFLYSSGYLLASYIQYKGYIKSINTKHQCILAFVSTALSQLILAPPMQEYSNVWFVIFGLFIFGFF